MSKTDTPLIAVVNNDTNFLQMMCDLLSDAGYRAYAHKDAADAYERLKKDRPDLVVLDIRLSAAELGWSILELLKLDPETRHLPVIVCSADIVQLREKAPRLRELNCATLEKPFDLEELLQLIAVGLGTSPQT
jgi:CheY-like chemotaxis protein